MSQTDPILSSLMAKGAPFEVVQDGSVRVFQNAPSSLVSVFKKAREFGSLEFIRQGAQQLSYDGFFRRADSLANYIAKTYDITAGQSVGICMKNSAEWMIAFVAIINLGGVAVLVNSRASAVAMSQALIDADTVLVIADHTRVNRLDGAGSIVPVLAAAEIMALPEASFEPAPLKPEDPAVMLFTSGTTGVAKAALISHRALVTGVMNTQLAMAAVFMKMAKAYGIDVQTLKSQMPQSSSLLVFPLFHISGCSAIFLTTLSSGGRLVVMESWDPVIALELIETEKISSIGGVPAMYWDMLRDASFAQRDLSSLMSLSCGGQSFPQNLIEEIREKFPKAFIGAGYGMTENSGAVSQANGEAFLAKPDASGQILPMVDVQISSPEGVALPIGQTGEIWVKGATLMDGYYGRDEDTRKAFNGPWYKTGDIGYLDDEGYIYIVDRKTDMVISGGENIYCAEIEQVLSRHKDVQQVVSFGVADARLGERLIVCVHSPSKDLGKKDISEFAKQHLADYKHPSDIIISSTPFELNAMGKVEKHKIRDMYLKGIKT